MQANSQLTPFPDLQEAESNCPLHLIDDLPSFAIPPFAPRIIQCIPHVEESRRFRKMLSKLQPDLQENWREVKEGLTQSVPPPPRFKKLKGGLSGMWGVYLKNGFRAHLRRSMDGTWEACEIGPHKEMGHG